MALTAEELTRNPEKFRRVHALNMAHSLLERQRAECLANGFTPELAEDSQKVIRQMIEEEMNRGL